MKLTSLIEIETLIVLLAPINLYWENVVIRINNWNKSYMTHADFDDNYRVDIKILIFTYIEFWKKSYKVTITLLHWYTDTGEIK